MHFKNKHSETPLDLNKVMISRVVCYICGVRKKEYAILVRHFQVEHKDQEIDPFKIGMDEPTPFNLSPEEEAELMKLPIPEPVKHDPSKRPRQMQNMMQSMESMMAESRHTPSEMINNDTMDSLGDDYNCSSTPPMMAKLDDDHFTPPMMAGVDDDHFEESSHFAKKSKPSNHANRRLSRAFKNNKCRACGKAFSRITTAKKHFLDQHPNEMFDKTKIEVTQLPCYLCDTMITDSRHALRHFEAARPGMEYDARQVQVTGVEFTNGANDETDMLDLDESSENLNDLKHDADYLEDAKKLGFRCFLCNFWCSTIEDFQVHFAPETKAHENVSEVTIICPVCMHKCETTEEMFDHVTNEHSASSSTNDNDHSLAASKPTVNNTNCVETC